MSREGWAGFDHTKWLRRSETGVATLFFAAEPARGTFCPTREGVKGANDRFVTFDALASRIGLNTSAGEFRVLPIAGFADEARVGNFFFRCFFLGSLLSEALLPDFDSPFCLVFDKEAPPQHKLTF
mmetsp:Transcript_22439/g.44503  ORF Transcript_22439/g.44503 Transcript_22439/m.44503 type:complete len:126 (+) Transcript_22439:231-608(+)